MQRLNYRRGDTIGVVDERSLDSVSLGELVACHLETVLPTVQRTPKAGIFGKVAASQGGSLE